MFGTSAAPVSKEFSEAIEKGTINLDGEEELDEFIKQLQSVQESKFGRAASINLLNINNGKNTIEFRVANGTIDPNVWIENVRLFGRIVQVSEQLAQIEKKEQSEVTEEDKRLLDLMEHLKETKMPEREKMEVLLELLFTEEERIIYRERYDENSKKLEELSVVDNPLARLEFAEKVDFRKHTSDEFSGVARENCGGYKVATGETIGGVKYNGEKGKSGEQRV